MMCFALFFLIEWTVEKKAFLFLLEQSDFIALISVISNL